MNAAVADAIPIAEVTPSEAHARQLAGAVVLDVREAHERDAGMALGSIGLARAEIEAQIALRVGNLDQEILTLCGTGRRSLLAAETLRALGYRRVGSVSGGYARWLADGLPLAPGALDARAIDRYSRHLLLPEVGVAGQTKLAHARVALIGAGGLGSPAALYLAAAGVGTLRLIDDDRVERSNLQRQVVHSDARVGMSKVESAAIALNALNPEVRVDLRAARLAAANVEELLRDIDVVLDGADNFPTRYLLDAACRQLRIPLVYGAVHRFSGQASVFDARRTDSPCYRCLFPDPPSAAEAPNCAEAGVLGVLPGIIGMLQATETIKLILGIGDSLVGRLLCYDALGGSFRELRLARDPHCPGCGAQAKFSGYEDIAQICAAH
jgi:sulfur-carrier protein adenylyltransferase/sulfurtransferase